MSSNLLLTFDHIAAAIRLALKHQQKCHFLGRFPVTLGKRYSWPQAP